ncbi:histidine kinase-like ATPase [Ochromonadaceae sp. CCMP2298]|nr:histidine kinase-like ATPase [Ochromonadaceae sp. CCMP2298]
MFPYSHPLWRIQVLRNLMSNSLKFTKEKGVVSVLAEYLPNGLPQAVIPQASSLLLDDPRAGAVRITVKDDGAGLSPAQVGDICKEGVQFNANTLQAGGGSGLGLFIGKGIAEQHGGTMRVSSEGLGKGATFVIDLPLFKVEGLEEPLTPDEAEDNETRIFTPLLPPVTKYLLVVDGEYNIIVGSAWVLCCCGCFSVSVSACVSRSRTLR